MNTRARIGKVLRRWADRIDHHGAPRSIDWSFTIEQGHGLVFHNDRKTGCPLYYLGTDDYEKAHRDAGFDNGGILPSGMTMPAEQFDRLLKFPGNPTPEFRAALERAREFVQEERISANLNPWAGVGVVGLHNHTETDMCDDTCTTYGEGPPA